MVKNDAVERLQTSLAQGGLKHLVAARQRAARHSVLLVDTSGSMAEPIADGSRKVDELRKVLTTLRESHAEVPVVAFDGHGSRVVDGTSEPYGGTPLAAAIHFVRGIQGTHIVLISDGLPDNPSMAIDAARAFGGAVDTFFVGNLASDGAEFLRQLSQLTGGQSNVTDLGEPKQLAGKIAGLLGPTEPPHPSAIAL